MPMNSINKEIWQKILDQDWNLDFVKRHLKNERTFYQGRPILYSAEEIFTKNILKKINQQKYLLVIDDQEIQLQKKDLGSIVETTFKQLNKISQKDSRDPACIYLRQQTKAWEKLKVSQQLNYGFFAIYFDRQNKFSHIIQFPPLPVFKLALTASCGPLYRDAKYEKSWYQIRRIFNNAHVFVAGASVASLTATSIIRDGRVGYLTIGDPKGPNATNLNRTNFSVLDIVTQESKAISFARQIHEQDPSQVIYIEAEGFSEKNLPRYFTTTSDYRAIDVVVEAVDSIFHKIDILRFAQKKALPIVQIADVGSKAEVSFNNPSDIKKGKSLVLGVSNKKLEKLIEKDFLAAAMYFVGIGNAFDDEIGLFLKEKSGTPFINTTPQMGSTAMAAAGMATEKVLRYLIDKKTNEDFAYKRLVFDKKNNSIKAQEWPDIKSVFMSLIIDLQKIIPKKRKK